MTEFEYPYFMRENIYGDQFVCMVTGFTCNCILGSNCRYLEKLERRLENERGIS